MPPSVQWQLGTETKAVSSEIFSRIADVQSSFNGLGTNFTVPFCSSAIFFQIQTFEGNSSSNNNIVFFLDNLKFLAKTAKP